MQLLLLRSTPPQLATPQKEANGLPQHQLLQVLLLPLVLQGPLQQNLLVLLVVSLLPVLLVALVLLLELLKQTVGRAVLYFSLYCRNKELGWPRE